MKYDINKMLETKIEFNPEFVQPNELISNQICLRKSQPTSSQVYVDAPLMNVSTLFSQEKLGQFKAEKIFPIVPVQKRTGFVTNFNKDYFFTNNVKKIAPGTKSMRIGFEVDFTNQYICDEYSIEHIAPDQVSELAQFDYEVVSTQFVTEQLYLNREIITLGKVFADVWGKKYTGVANTAIPGTSFIKWSDYVNSNPILDVTNAKVDFQLRNGMLPNKLVMGYDVFETLRFHPLVKSMILFKEAGELVSTEAILAKIFGVDEIVVCNATYNTAKEGSTANYSFITSKQAVLMYVAPSPGLYTPSAGYMFSWDASIGQGFNIVIRNYRQEDILSNIINGRNAFDPKVLLSSLGTYFKDCIS